VLDKCSLGVHNGLDMEDNAMPRFEPEFFLVWNPEGDVPRVRHADAVDARREAERLARLNPNAAFYVLRAEGRCRVDAAPVKWDTLESIPF
jgi:hypothetical protein